METNSIIIIILILAMILMPTLSSVIGWYYLEKIIKLNKTQKTVYLEAQKALETKQYDLLGCDWIDGDGGRILSYNIILNLPMGQLKLNTLHCETLCIKTSNNKFEQCPDLSSAHLIILCRNFAKKILLDKEKEEENERQNRILSAQNKIVNKIKIV